ncbi:MAG TPA: hypothetical protein VHO70_09755 [Chitinispirillaceae bacterium]|nr:hypothetical protein [Chitinispirillaceae bacterium]
MNKCLNEQDDSFFGFEVLSSAVVDSSSIIYMQKIGILNLTADCIKLHMPEIVSEETGIEHQKITIHYQNRGIRLPSADKQVVQLAVDLEIPVISEDKKVLKWGSKEGLSYYNTLMLLNYLLYKKKVTVNQYNSFYRELLPIARYSAFVLSYGEIVKKKITD